MPIFSAPITSRTLQPILRKSIHSFPTVTSAQVSNHRYKTTFTDPPRSLTRSNYSLEQNYPVRNKRELFNNYVTCIPAVNVPNTFQHCLIASTFMQSFHTSSQSQNKTQNEPIKEPGETESIKEPDETESIKEPGETESIKEENLDEKKVESTENVIASSSENIASENVVTENVVPENAAGENVQLSMKDKLKRAVRDYGATIIVFHVTLALTNYGLTYLAISSGLDLPYYLYKLGMSEELIQSKIMTGASTGIVAYAIYKIFAPVRIAITLTVAPILVRYMRRKGVLKMPKVPTQAAIVNAKL